MLFTHALLQSYSPDSEPFSFEVIFCSFPYVSVVGFERPLSFHQGVRSRSQRRKDPGLKLLYLRFLVNAFLRVSMIPLVKIVN